MASTRLQNAVKALLLIGMGLFLLSRVVSGTLYYYINERFAVLTVIAIFGLILLGVSYRMVRDDHDHEDHAGHDHGHDHHHHGLTWAGAALVAVPIVLGFAVPARPLGAAAMANREVNVELRGSAMPAAVRSATAKPAGEKNILDWFHLLRASADPVQEFAGQEAKVTGFVYRDDRFGADQFMVTRYTVSCCVADASVVGLVVRWPGAADLPLDQWVEVSGPFVADTFAGEPYPILAADALTETGIPSQPYLFP